MTLLVPSGVSLAGLMGEPDEWIGTTQTGSDLACLPGAGPLQVGQQYCVCDPETYKNCTPAQIQEIIVASADYRAAQEQNAAQNQILGMPRNTFYLVAGGAALLLLFSMKR